MLDCFLTIEGIDYLTCQICGGKFKQINNFHLKIHNFTPAEYQDLYPDAQMISDLTRKKICDMNKGQNNPMFGRKGEKHHFFGKHHTKESKKKTSESLKEGLRTGRIIPLSGENHPFFGLVGEKHHSFGRKVSDETKAKLSEANKGRIISDETKQKISDAHIESYRIGTRERPFGEKNPFFGKTHSDETKDKISESLKEGLRTGRIEIPKHIGGFNTGFRTDLNQFFRSNWEANVARILNYQEIDWKYEPKRFDLGDCTYLPDFYLPEYNLWIEVKGYMRDQDEQKIHLFREMGYNLILIDKPAYKQLEKEYKSLIPKWETSKNTNIVRRIRVRGRAIKGNFTYRNVKKLFKRASKHRRREVKR